MTAQIKICLKSTKCMIITWVKGCWLLIIYIKTIQVKVTDYWLYIIVICSLVIT